MPFEAIDEVGQRLNVEFEFLGNTNNLIFNPVEYLLGQIMKLSNQKCLRKKEKLNGLMPYLSCILK